MLRRVLTRICVASLLLSVVEATACLPWDDLCADVVCRPTRCASSWRQSYETIINLIGNTTNRGGLVVRARLDRRRYPTGKKISAKEMRALKVERDDFHGDWNYVIKPRGRPS